MVPQSESVKELLTSASERLTDLLKTYKDSESQNMKILQTFGLDSLLQEVPLELFSKNDVVDFDFIRQVEAERLNGLSNKLFISQMDKSINIFQRLNSSLEARISKLKRGLTKYEEEFYEKSEVNHQDFLNTDSSLEKDIQKCTANIFKDNNELENTKDVINKLRQCFEMKNKIDQYRTEKENTMKEMQSYRLLPPNIYEAEKKLNELERKYRETSEEFSRSIRAPEKEELFGL